MADGTTLVLGGARSGKSAVAEALVVAGSSAPVTYVATAEPPGDGDPGWAARVAAHRARRPTDWSTVELSAASDLADTLYGIAGPVMVDSLGLWVARTPDMAVEQDLLLAALSARTVRGDRTVVVSEEVGLGVHPPTDAGRRFRDVLGALNQAVGAVADEVVLVVAGLTIVLGPPVAPGGGR